MNVGNNKLHLINDSIVQSDFKSINRKPDNKFILSTIQMRMLETESVNRNNRFYGKEILDVILNNPFVKESLKNHSMVGELEHPSDGRIYTDYDKASHIITDLWKDGNWLWGSIDILNTPAGQKIQAIIDAGCSIGISARGYGSHTNKPNDSVDYIDSDTYELFTFDFTNMPGFSEARLNQNSNNSKRESLHDNILSVLDKKVNTKTCENIKTICEYQNSVGNNFNDILKKLESRHININTKKGLFEENKNLNRRYDLVPKERTKLNKKTTELEIMQSDVIKRLNKLENARIAEEKYASISLKNKLRETRLKLEREKKSNLNLKANINNLKLENQNLKKSLIMARKYLAEQKRLKKLEANISEQKKRKKAKAAVSEQKKQKKAKAVVSESISQVKKPSTIKERQEVQQVNNNYAFPQYLNQNKLAQELAKKAEKIWG